MKKTSKLFGAVALSAALAMGTVAPAFAADADDELLKTGSDKVSTTDEAQNVKGKAANSYINVVTEIDQLNVTVPLHMTVVAKVSGGALTTPSNNAYAIINNSSTGIKVTKIEAEQRDMNWDLTTDAVDNNTSAPDGKIGKINLKAKPTAAGAAEVMIANAAKTGGVTNPTGWSVAAPTADATVAPKLVIDWSSSASSKLRDTYKNQTQGSSTESVSLDAFKISYTIEGDAGNIEGQKHAE